jgi:hypothetical protein
VDALAADAQLGGDVGDADTGPLGLLVDAAFRENP